MKEETNQKINEILEIIRHELENQVLLDDEFETCLNLYKEVKLQMIFNHDNNPKFSLIEGLGYKGIAKWKQPI